MHKQHVQQQASCDDIQWSYSNIGQEADNVTSLVCAHLSLDVSAVMCGIGSFYTLVSIQMNIKVNKWAEAILIYKPADTAETLFISLHLKE